MANLIQSCSPFRFFVGTADIFGFIPGLIPGYLMLNPISWILKIGLGFKIEHDLKLAWVIHASNKSLTENHLEYTIHTQFSCLLGHPVQSTRLPDRTQ